MEHHAKEEEKSYDYLYYVVALVCGLFTGAVVDSGYTWIFVGGILGLLMAALFLKVFVRGREER
ncbi:MAG: hypothetical protein JST32_07215 [Bacteroidetes bacterium]|nr:hypothetical protein [Bacteroidota bacterium]